MELQTYIPDTSILEITSIDFHDRKLPRPIYITYNCNFSGARSLPKNKSIWKVLGMEGITRGSFITLHQIRQRREDNFFIIPQKRNPAKTTMYNGRNKLLEEVLRHPNSQFLEQASQTSYPQRFYLIPN